MSSGPKFQPFEDTTTPKVAIVGAAGYVGSALHKHLREQGYSNVRGFDRNPRAIKFEQVARCQGVDQSPAMRRYPFLQAPKLHRNGEELQAGSGDRANVPSGPVVLS
jgi:nucleoside-diphosphate-sugar epimerase